MSFIQYEHDSIPLSTLPYAFKCRVINLATNEKFAQISKTCSKIKSLRYRRVDFYNQVFIADDQEVLEAAIKERDADGCFFNIYQNYSFLKYLSDGSLTIHPRWEDVLRVNDIISKNEPLYINDTLILDVSSNESYDRIVPLINGPYSRLVLYGELSWNQIKRLIHDEVKQVRIMSVLEVDEDDDIVKFVFQFSRGIEYKFSFDNASFNPVIVHQLYDAYENHDKLNIFNSMGMTHVVDKNCQRSYYRYAAVFLFINICVLLLFFYFFNFDFTDEDNGRYAHIQWIISLMSCLTVVGFHVGLVFIGIGFPKDIEVFYALNGFDDEDEGSDDEEEE